MLRKKFLQRALTLIMALILSGATIAWLARLNERMTVRYQAIGRVVDATKQPVAGVEAILLLAPPPPHGPQRDALFPHMADDGVEPGHTYIGQVSPVVGLSDASGAFLVRTRGRLGPAHAIRLGLDRSGRPPFETAWLLLRRDGQPDITRTISILSWRAAPKDWGTFANRIPLIVLRRD